MPLKETSPQMPHTFELLLGDEGPVEVSVDSVRPPVVDPRAEPGASGRTGLWRMSWCRSAVNVASPGQKGVCFRRRCRAPDTHRSKGKPIKSAICRQGEHPRPPDVLRDGRVNIGEIKPCGILKVKEGPQGPPTTSSLPQFNFCASSNTAYRNWRILPVEAAAVCVQSEELTPLPDANQDMGRMVGT